MTNKTSTVGLKNNCNDKEKGISPVGFCSEHHRNNKFAKTESNYEGESAHLTVCELEKL